MTCIKGASYLLAFEKNDEARFKPQRVSERRYDHGQLRRVHEYCTPTDPYENHYS
jgi:hypothetical protein